jgi:hypothetical protein
MNKETRNGNNILIGKSSGHLGVDGRIIIKVDLKVIGYALTHEFNGQQDIILRVSCEKGNSSSGSITGGKFRKG